MWRSRDSSTKALLLLRLLICWCAWCALIALMACWCALLPGFASLPAEVAAGSGPALAPATLGLACLLSWVLVSLASSCVPFSASERRAVLAGRVVLVTGGASGIGAETCLQLARAGAIVAVWDVQLGPAQALVRRIAAEGGTAHAWAVDVSDRDAVRRAAAALRRKLGTDVFALVNNAGIVSGARLLELRPEQIERTMGVNVLAHFWTLQEFLPAMLGSVADGQQQQGGHIVTVASTMSFSAASGLSDYVASKHAVWGMHECLRLELAQLHAQGHARIGSACAPSCHSLLTAWQL